MPDCNMFAYPEGAGECKIWVKLYSFPVFHISAEKYGSNFTIFLSYIFLQRKSKQSRGIAQ